MSASKAIDYNAEPLYVCKHCLSLAEVVDGNVRYCPRCGNTKYVLMPVWKYEQAHIKKYGKRFLEMTKQEIRQIEKMYKL